ncbi:hypothetical protein ONZ45_g3722 [Pleurotus djamor]|nr:hypothetical protein ONZ45_g3722 [Pleurotus djamor]
MPYLKGMLERDKSTKLRQSDALLARQATLKLSRDATREVRRCLRMRESAKAESRVRTLRLAHRPIDSIYLSPDDAGTRIIPSRLPGHALIHGLVRSQKPTRAAKQIRSLIEDGTNVKHATFSAVMRGLLNQARKITKAPQTDNDSWSAPNETVLELDPDKIHNKYCRHALILLMIARKHGVKREMWMYIRLINTLVTHKSYLEATLVVESLLKDWRVWNALHSFFASVPPQSSDPNTYWIISGDRLATHSQVVQSELYQLYQQLSVSYLEPTPALLAKCIIPLNDAFRTNPTPPSKATIMSILQPFMVLLSLLERRLYPFSSVGRIIRAVSDLPAHWNLREHIVWTTKRLKGGKSEERQPRKVPNIQIEADKILEGLMTSLPSRPRDPPTSSPLHSG